VWISNGLSDQIAPSRLQEKVYFSLKRTEFKNVRLEGFFGGHQLKRAEVHAR
jgi:predicted esterase